MARRLHRQIAHTFRVAFLLAGAVSITACSKAPAAPPKTEVPVSPPAPSASGVSTGVVSGRTPAASNGFSAIVILESKTAGDSPPQAYVPYMDQTQETFTPPVLLVRTGQPTEFRNNDEVLHNVRVREDETKLPAFNVAIPTGEKYTFSFPRDGFYDVGCDIHPGMFAQIVSTSSPYATVADAEGNFSIEGVPPGAYKAIVYAGGKRLEKDVQVPAASLDLTE